MTGQTDEGRLVAGRYRLMERIGRGGMGTVWRAEDELLGRQVAVKKLHPPQPHMLDDELATMFERTRREARAAARISHPNVVVVHDVVDDAGLPSIVMEYVPSVTLGERLKESGPLPVAEVARIGRGMVAALRAAHRAGVLHRDVKPGNVLLGREGGGADDEDGRYGDGRVVLTDFGIAQASGTSTLTRTGELIGSIDFLSPERIRGAVPGPEADMWALGATLYQAVQGESPFRRPTAIETAYAIAEEPVIPAANAGALTRVIAGLLAKEPAERLSAEEVERMLRIPAADQDTALVGQVGFQQPPAAEPDAEPPTTRVPRGAAAAQPADGSTPPTSYPATAVVQGPPPGPGPYEQHGHSGQQPPQVPYSQGSSGPGRKQRRLAPLLASVLAVAVLGGGAYFGVTHLRNSGASDHRTGPNTPVSTQPTTLSPTPTPTAATPAPPPLPAGYHQFDKPDRGYTVPVPDGWKKDVKDGGDQVNFVDPSGKVGLKISALDYASVDPYEHWVSIEPATRSQVDDYHRERMDHTTNAVGEPAALWQFTFRGTARDFRAIDLGFGKKGGREYAIYLSAPKAQWDDYKAVFDNAVAGFRQTTP
ncbi:protein kinase [Streptomyces sp. NPDC051976]|uniref:protein kinase domain-containing protein n=1 Tax=Streptomyces sp. NPDC051976 TaxID=3154947 RepID=UPI003424F3EF